MPVQWEEITEEAFNSLPEPQKPAPKVDHEWEELLSRLDQGTTVRIPFTDDKSKRGTRLALGRRAARRGFKVQIRYGDNYLAARKSEEDLTPKAKRDWDAAEKPKPQNGRRKRRTSEE